MPPLLPNQPVHSRCRGYPICSRPTLSWGRRGFLPLIEWPILWWGHPPESCAKLLLPLANFFRSHGSRPSCRKGRTRWPQRYQPPSCWAHTPIGVPPGIVCQSASCNVDTFLLHLPFFCVLLRASARALGRDTSSALATPQRARRATGKGDKAKNTRARGRGASRGARRAQRPGGRGETSKGLRRTDTDFRAQERVGGVSPLNSSVRPPSSPLGRRASSGSRGRAAPPRTRR